MNYKNTRKEVENLVNNKIVPSLKNKNLDASTYDVINTIMFLYSVDRMDALEALIKLAVIDLTGNITPDQLMQIGKYFK